MNKINCENNDFLYYINVFLFIIGFYYLTKMSFIISHNTMTNTILIDIQVYKFGRHISCTKDYMSNTKYNKKMFN